MQSFPVATAATVKPEETVGAQSALLRAFAAGGATIEIAESVETAKTKGINEATKRRALRIKVTRLAPISVISLSGPAEIRLLFNQALSE
jgi:hypothetical protein